MKWTDNRIAEWHIRTFPDCTREEQIKKLGNEFIEYLREDSLSGKKIELADVYIASVVTWLRYGSITGHSMKYWIEKELRSKELCIGKDEFQSVIDAKMDINIKRKWIRTSDGTYQHIK